MRFFALCDELAQTNFGCGFLLMFNQGVSKLACVATSLRVGNLPGGFLCFGSLSGIELRFQCKN